MYSNRRKERPVESLLLNLPPTQVEMSKENSRPDGQCERIKFNMIWTV